MAEWPVFYTRDLIADDLLEIGDGYRAKNSEMGDSGLPFVRAGDVHGRVNTVGTDVLSIESVSRVGAKRSQTGDVVITTKGTVGRVAFVAKDDPEFVYSPQLCYWRSKERGKLLPRWLFYALQSNEVKHQMGWSASQTDMAPYLSLTDQRNSFYLTVPPISEQIAIAEILGSLDDKSDLNRRMNETLEAMARAIFKDWFVDFGPTRAKAEGRAPYLAPELWDLFPDRLNDQHIPAGWRVLTVGACFHLTMGQSPPGSTYNKEGKGLPFFQGRTDFGSRYPENRVYCTEPTRIAELDDTLVSVRAPVGDINMAWEKCCAGRGVAALRHHSGYRSFTYYSAWAIQQELRQYEHTGTVFGAINKRQFEALNVLEPGPEIISGFESHVGLLDKCIRKNVYENRSLAEARDLLLPKLMSGEIRLAEVTDGAS